MKTSHEMAQNVLKRQKKILRRRHILFAAVGAAAGVGAIAGVFALTSAFFPSKGVDLIESSTPGNNLTLPDNTKYEPLDLLGFIGFGQGKYYIDINIWEISNDYELFRKYFFGTWETSDSTFSEKMVIDDTEQAYFCKTNAFRFDNFYIISENVLAFVIQGSGECELFWLDINSPETMYHEPYVEYRQMMNSIPPESADNESFGGSWLYDIEDLPHKPAVYRKTAEPINAPEKSLLSVYRLRELSRDYGIDMDMLLFIEYNDKDSGERLLHDDWYHLYPVYLVSEAPDKLVFRTTVGNITATEKEVSVTYTIKKIGGEWTRTVQFVNINSNLLSTEDGISFQKTATNAAEEYLRNDKEQLSEYLVDPEYDTGLSENSENLFGKLDYSDLTLIDDSIAAFETGKVYPAVYKFALLDRDMLFYLDIGLRKTDSGWKVEYIYLQG
ncbi:MAG: hypothetical protein J6A19_12415 [Oscillospiraceae bacterium]|nr:hypothetical protein [Oscillospiraceae bacterium]